LPVSETLYSVIKLIVLLVDASAAPQAHNLVQTFIILCDTLATMIAK